MSGPESDGNEGVLYIPQSSSITEASASDCLMSYLGHSVVVGGSYPSEEVQSVYSTTSVDWADVYMRPTKDTLIKQHSSDQWICHVNCTLYIYIYIYSILEKLT